LDIPSANPGDIPDANPGDIPGSTAEQGSSSGSAKPSVDNLADDWTDPYAS